MEIEETGEGHHGDNRIKRILGNKAGCISETIRYATCFFIGGEIYLKLVYLASPLRGDYDRNIKKAVEYSRLVSECGVLPLAPHIIFSQWCNDTIPEQREQGLKLGLALLEKCDELWVMGNEISQGMQGEINFAREHSIQIYFVPYPTLKEFYPLSTDKIRLLDGRDCVEDSTGMKEDYNNRFVLLKFESLKPEYRNARNQLWVATHGPGCRADGGRFSDTVHLLHPIDGDRMAVSRQEILGISKEETVEMLKNAYPDFVSGFTNYGEEEDEELCQ